MSVILERLTGLQEQRQHEYVDQANSAQQLLSKLVGTRMEAERISKKEFENTISLRDKLIEQHPLMSEWKGKQREISRQREEMEKNRNRHLFELEQLRVQRGELQSELDRWKRHEMEKDQRIESIENQIQKLNVNIRQLQEAHEKEREREKELQRERGTNLDILQNLEFEMKNNRNSKDAKEKELGSLNQEIKGLEAHLNMTELRHRELLGKSQELEGKCNQAKYEESETMSLEARTKELYQTRLDKLRKLQESLGEKSETLVSSENAKSEFINLLQKTLSEIEQVDSKISFIKQKLSDFNGRKRAIREQIEQLLREEYQIDQEIIKYNKEIDDQDSLKVVLKTDEMRIKGDIDHGQRIISSIKESIDQLSSQINQENQFSKQLKDEFQNIENEKAKSKDFYQKYSNELFSIRKMIEQIEEGSIGEAGLADGKEWKLGQIQQQQEKSFLPLKGQRSEIDKLYNKQSFLHVECNSIDEEYRKIHGEFDSINRRFGEFERVQKESGNVQSNIANQIFSLKNQVNDLGSRRMTMKSSETIMNNLQGKLEKITADMNYIENNLERNVAFPSSSFKIPLSFPSLMNEEDKSASANGKGNESGREIREREELANIEKRVHELVDSSPPSILQQQLCREAEALMRYEASLAMEQRQFQVLKDAEELAKIKLKKERVNFVIDNEGQKELLSRHEMITGKDQDTMIVPRMGEKIMEMCHKHHIVASNSFPIT